MSNAAVHDETASLSARKGWWFRIRGFFNKSRPPQKGLDKAPGRPPPTQPDQTCTDNGPPSTSHPSTEVPDKPDPQSSLPEEFRAGLNERIEGGKLELPLLSDVVMEVMNLCTSDDADSRKLADILHRDQTLAGHVLRVANSPAYKPRMPIVSLRQAVSRLGMTQLFEIAYTVSVQSRVFKVKGYEHLTRTLWQHAFGAGVYSKEIARMQGYDTEKAFLWGLLHDVGKPVILLTLIELQLELGSILEPLAVVEAMDEYHTQIGGLLASRWELPVIVQESIVYHHDYFAAPTCVEAAMVTCLADCLSHNLMHPDDFSEESVRQHPVVAYLRCSPDNVTALLAKREKIVQSVEAMAF